MQLNKHLNNSMKKIILLTISLVAAFSFSASARASNQVRSETYVVAADQVVQGNQYVSSQTVRVDGVIKGDLVASTGSLIINGTVEGSILAGASSVEVKGTVLGSIRTVSQDITISGKVGGDVTVIASTFTLTESGNVANDLIFGGGESTVRGTVIGSTRTSNWTEVPTPTSTQRIYSLFSLFLSLSLLGVLLLSVQRDRITTAIYQSHRSRFALSSLIGFLSILFIPIISIILLITPVGRWVGILGILLVMVLVIISIIDAGYFIGRMLLSKQIVTAKMSIGVLLLGLFIVSILLNLSLISFIGIFIIISAFGNRLLVMRDSFNA